MSTRVLGRSLSATTGLCLALVILLIGPFQLFMTHSASGSTFASMSVSVQASDLGWSTDALVEFRGVQFSIGITWQSGGLHNLALYSQGYDPQSVYPGDHDALGRTGVVSSSSPTSSLTFIPTGPRNDYSGLARYEYFCEFHPTVMHGHITVYKSPDIIGDQQVDIADLVSVARSFGSTPSLSSWSANADLNNDGSVDIVDLVMVASYFGGRITPSPTPAPNLSPHASFSAIASSTTVQFDASKSNDPDDPIQVYVWNFNDGSPITYTMSSGVAHSFPDSSQRAVSLTVIDSRGATGTVSDTVFSSDPPPDPSPPPFGVPEFSFHWFPPIFSFLVLLAIAARRRKKRLFATLE